MTEPRKEETSSDEGQGLRAPFRRVRKAKSSEGWLRAIRKTIQLANAQTVLFFGLTPSSGALSFSKPFSKVARIPRLSSQKNSPIPPCRFLRSSTRKFTRQSREFKNGGEDGTILVCFQVLPIIFVLPSVLILRKNGKKVLDSRSVLVEGLLL